ncbi:hypothetical protein LI99_32220 [Mycolicibacterium smegmatis]|uniref:Uncharacterized protein n=1 Tax=Mycolicibacterium smegmatis (strain ATCC 700084 / mc(2)155) TaxID=246196 RepID=A0R6E2_MYCS2|nr:hypothetical protein MSMEG_6516 [Mycolicibacterium smegmatis MC2 155]AIU18118.1 hypothetical protein LI99_32220 [Mycolicibacterium smegmatis]AIU11492.1 hypothetical protein LJ00_32215 [Mycolicibacterium smegmatis MC2 155]AIU24740.1 hypothetical protein LI98_32225 [Mycolicibacterium smegmatis]TBH30326.1 hypothetical protein EYS45_26710 [Mycolicibacterium smegmatis MC2 155]
MHRRIGQTNDYRCFTIIRCGLSHRYPSSKRCGPPESVSQRQDQTGENLTRHRLLFNR